MGLTGAPGHDGLPGMPGRDGMQGESGVVAFERDYLPEIVAENVSSV